MKHTPTLLRCVAVAAGTLAAATAWPSPAPAADIIAEWATVTSPPAPELQSVTLEGRTTALLILDMRNDGCGSRQRCLDTVPKVKSLHDAACAAGAMVFYTFPGREPPSADSIVDPGIAPREGEWIWQRGPDKFLGSDLEERLEARNIDTVVICGTSAQGVGIGTSSGAAQRGYNVVVPIDCLSSDEPVMEKYAIYHLYEGGPNIITDKVTLTRSDMINF